MNTLRNVALNNARTDFVILADVDFVPVGCVEMRCDAIRCDEMI